MQIFPIFSAILAIYGDTLLLQQHDLMALAVFFLLLGPLAHLHFAYMTLMKQYHTEPGLTYSAAYREW